MNKRWILVGWLLSVLALPGAPGWPLSVEELTREAELVVRGRVLSKSCQRDDAGRVYTRVECQVEEVWKGRSAGDPLVIVHSGGSIGRQRLTVPNQVEFQVGEEAVVFLRLNQRGEGVCLGMAQGKFRVWPDSSTGETLASNGFEETPASPGPAAKHSTPLTLAQLRLRVRGGGR